MWRVELKCYRRGFAGSEIVEFEIAAPRLDEAVMIARTRAARTDDFVAIDLVDAEYLGERPIPLPKPKTPLTETHYVKLGYSPPVCVHEGWSIDEDENTKTYQLFDQDGICVQKGTFRLMPVEVPVASG
jgi:hypothetical protein